MTAAIAILGCAVAALALAGGVGLRLTARDFARAQERLW